MSIGHRERQTFDQVIDVSKWEVDPENPQYPEGKQPKQLLISPNDPTYPFLLPNHKYLFKTPRGWQERQIWSELIAYEFSRTLNITVPPCFLAYNSKHQQFGVLIEFFYGYAGEQQMRFVPGSDIMHRVYGSAYDRRRGRPHSIRSNMQIARAYSINDYLDWWPKALLFDALIGNSDRHPDNWGILSTRTSNGVDTLKMAPLFDNGSSLSYGDLDRKLTLNNLDDYIDRGTHHCGWTHPSEKGTGHIELCELFFQRTNYLK